MKNFYFLLLLLSLVFQCPLFAQPAAEGIGGTVTFEDGTPLREIQFEGVDIQTNIDGTYMIPTTAINIDSFYLQPYIEDAYPFCGITTFDLVLMSKHILGTDPLDNAAQFKAADINNDGTITMEDYDLLQQYLDGEITAFPNNDFWQFVYKEAFEGIDPSNPWVVPAVPEPGSFSDDNTEDFIAIKIGDINSSSKQFCYDNLAPPICLNGITIPALDTSTGCVDIMAKDLLENHMDFDSIAIRRLGSQGALDSVITLCCEDLGVSNVEVWGFNSEGNGNFCTTYIILQDNGEVCGDSYPIPSGIGIGGYIHTETQKPVPNVSFKENPNVSTSEIGSYILSEQFFSFITTATPCKDDDHLNGITTFDVLLLSLHIIGVQTLDSPYKLIAADINNDGNITTFDVVQLRQLILNIIPKFPSNTSWRFVDKNFEFTNPENPWSGPFPETISDGSLNSFPTTEDFIGIKIGDLNDSVFEEEEPIDNLMFRTQDNLLVAGQSYQVDFTADNFDNILTYQFSINFDETVLEYIDYESDLLIKAIYQPISSPNILTTAFNHLDFEGISQNEDFVLFSLTFKAKQNALLSNVLQFNNNLTPALVFLDDIADPTVWSVDLAFTEYLPSAEVECMSSLSVFGFPNSYCTNIWAVDAMINPYNFDTYGIRRLNDTIPPALYIEVCCDEFDIGSSKIEFDIEVWGFDSEGNGDLCITTIILDYPPGYDCPCYIPNQTPIYNTIKGNISKANGTALDKVSLTLNRSCDGVFLASTNTDVDGNYNYGDFEQGTYEIEAEYDDNISHQQGVSVLDVIQARRAILNNEVMPHHQRIANDVNNDERVTNFDLGLMTDLILHKSNTFPIDNIWNFISSDQANDIFSPTTLITVEPIYAYLLEMEMDDEFDIIGIKKGDINCSLFETQTPFLDTLEMVAYLETGNALSAGQDLMVDFKFNNFGNTAGMQFTLEFDTELVEIIQEPRDLYGFDSGFVIFTNHSDELVNDGAFTFMGDKLSDEPNAISSDTTVFTIGIKVLKDTRLEDVFKLSSRYTAIEAYNDTLGLNYITLGYNDIPGNTTATDDLASEGFQLYQNQPNPFSTTTTIAFELPESATATLHIYDATGRLIKTIKGNYPQGTNEINIDKNNSNLSTKGVFYYQLETNKYSATRKMILL